MKLILVIYALTSLERSAAGKVKFVKRPDKSFTFSGGELAFWSSSYPRESVPSQTGKTVEIGGRVQRIFNLPKIERGWGIRSPAFIYPAISPSEIKRSEGELTEEKGKVNARTIPALLQGQLDPIKVSSFREENGPLRAHFKKTKEGSSETTKLLNAMYGDKILHAKEKVDTELDSNQPATKLLNAMYDNETLHANEKPGQAKLAATIMKPGQAELAATIMKPGQAKLVANNSKIAEYIRLTPSDNSKIAEYIRLTPSDKNTKIAEYIRLTPSDHLKTAEYIRLTPSDIQRSISDYLAHIMQRTWDHLAKSAKHLRFASSKNLANHRSNGSSRNMRIIFGIVLVKIPRRLFNYILLAKIQQIIWEINSPGQEELAAIVMPDKETLAATITLGHTEFEAIIRQSDLHSKSFADITKPEIQTLLQKQNLELKGENQSDSLKNKSALLLLFRPRELAGDRKLKKYFRWKTIKATKNYPVSS